MKSDQIGNRIFANVFVLFNEKNTEIVLESLLEIKIESNKQMWPIESQYFSISL